jgi:hypothetical protein
MRRWQGIAYEKPHDDHVTFELEFRCLVLPP